jgi:hypothetical protein
MKNAVFWYIKTSQETHYVSVTEPTLYTYLGDAQVMAFHLEIFVH